MTEPTGSAGATRAAPATDAPYAQRRQRVLRGLGDDGALIVASAPELRIGPDTDVRYVPDADLFYLTGYTEPGAVLVLCPSADRPYTLFVRDRDPAAERWTGVRGGVEAATERYGADDAHALGALAERLPGLVAGASRLFVRGVAGRPEVDAAVRDALNAGHRSRTRTGRGPHTLTDTSVLLAPMRCRKDAHEIALMRQAADITVDGFRAAHEAIGNASGEWQVEAALEHAFRWRGATTAFPSIVAGGANATVLHYTSNDAPLRPGSMLLVDGGARHAMYCGDISRTYAVGGRMSPEQQAIHDIVRRAHDAALAAARPGSSLSAVHDAAVAELAAGMVDTGLLEGDVADLIERTEHARYFPHRTSHWLGLDVHDAGEVMHPDGSPVLLEAGMVFTVEPGLYIPADDESAPAALRGIGVRLEDDVLITRDGADVLTGALPIA